MKRLSSACSRSCSRRARSPRGAWAQTQTTPTVDRQGGRPEAGTRRSLGSPEDHDGPKQSDTPKADYEKDKTGKSKSQVKDKRKARR